MTDIQLAYDALRGKLEPYTKLMAYADGAQPLVYSTTRLQEAFSNINVSFNQNWMSVVLDSALDRISFNGWKIDKDDSMTARLAEIYDEEQVGLESYDVHRAAMITHEAFLIAWKTAEDALEVYYNDPRMCHVFYEDSNPKKKRFAAKWWKTDEGYYRMTLYYPDRLEYYITADMVKVGVPSSAASFIPYGEAPVVKNPYGEIPVFHFRVGRNSSQSDLTNIITLQDAVNKLFADMMVSAEFGAFKQRYIITNADTSTLKNAPNEIWTIPAGEGQNSVGELSSADLDKYLNSIDKIANSIAIISRTPKHYFYGSGSNVSGEALLAMEAPLVAKVEQHERNFEVTWKEVAAFLLKLDGQRDAKKSTITIVWEPPQSIQPLTEAQTIKTYTEAQVPLTSALGWAGKTDEEIAEVTKAMDEEKKQKTSAAQALLEKIKLEQEQNNQNPADPGGGPAGPQDSPNIGQLNA